MSKLTPAQRKRLDKLATYLEGLPEDYAHFDMATWLDSDDLVAEARYARKNGGVPSCGTAACAAGHGPAAGVLVPPRFVAQNRYVNWIEYADWMSGDNKRSFWLFCSSWDFCDNHHWGAAARIRYLLDKGCLPFEFVYPAPQWIPVYAPFRIDAKQRETQHA